jgi:hypothetical protein
VQPAQVHAATDHPQGEQMTTEGTGLAVTARVGMLRRVPGLERCTEAELLALARRCREHDLAEGDRLGAMERAVVIDGWAALLVRREPVAALGPGDVFTARAMTAVAKTPMRLLVLDETQE